MILPQTQTATPNKDRPSPFKRAARRLQGKPVIDTPAPDSAAPLDFAPVDWPDPVDWIESNFYLYDTGQLIKLHHTQARMVREALRRDEFGNFVYSTVCWSWPKKSGKSTIIAAVAMYIAVHKLRASIKLIANDLKQADSRVGFYVREAIKLHPILRDTTKIKPSGYTIELANGSKIEMIPIDPEGEAGGNDDMIVYSELWGWKSKAQRKMWEEMTLSPNKYGTSQRWIDTYAGEDGEAPILQDLIYAPSVKPENVLWPDWEVYAYAPARMLTVWVTQHILPWQVSEQGRAYYAEQAVTLTPSAYDRMHGNKWGTSVQAFVQIEWWNACKGPLPPLDKYMQLAVGIDAAVSNDCFGIVAVSRHGESVAVRFEKAWYPNGDKLLYTDPNGDPDNQDYPEGVLRWLARTYNVIVFGYDPYQLHHLCNTLRTAGVGYFLEFNQGADRLEADKQLFDVIRDRRIMHSGEPDLTAHIKAANRKDDDESRKLRIIKRNAQSKIDLAVCLSTATNLAYKYLAG